MSEPQSQGRPSGPELGFGTVVSRQRARLINRDGSFNVRRQGLSWVRSLSVYHALLTMSWSRFMALALIAYLVMNSGFAVAYLVLGDALAGPTAGDLWGDFLRAFFFSVQTSSTIGYGHITPLGTAANVIVTVESFVGLLGFAMVTGLLFARFSRPVARVLFSERAVVAPFEGRTGFMFRIVNGRSSQLTEVEAKLLMSRLERGEDGARVRRFYTLPLQLSKVAFFPLSWTIVHPIDDDSPLAADTAASLVASEAELLILLTAIDETFNQTVHARSSYTAEEVVFGARFARIYEPTGAGEAIAIDVARLSTIESVAAGPGTGAGGPT